MTSAPDHTAGAHAAGTALPDAEPDGGPPRPAALLLQIGLALALAVLCLRLIAGSGGRSATPALPPVEQQSTAISTPAPTLALTAARPPATLPRTYLASVAEAGERLGFRVVQPGALPRGAGTLSVAWQLDEPVLTAGLLPGGTLLSWYFTFEHGVMLTLAQGPGKGLSVAGAPPGAHGAVTLADGRRLVWVEGHAGRGDPGAIVPRWIGGELRLGVPPVDGEPGWWLESGVLSLDELLAVAEGLR